MRLGTLFPDAGLARTAADRAVAGLTADSREVGPGVVFFAVPGNRADGLGFVPQACAAGAVAVVAERDPGLQGTEAAFIKVDDVRSALARSGARFYPGQPRTIVAVTGTSGKTSVAAFVRQIWAALGHQGASLGTIGVVAPSGAVYGALTTPDPIRLHKTLDELARDGVTHLVMEASSHGIAQSRLDGVRLAAAAFTNLTRDHLDYHRTIEDYLAAKLRLFDTLLDPGQPAVIDADSTVAAQVLAACEARGLAVFSVGAKGSSLRLLDARTEHLTTWIRVEHGGVSTSLRLPLAGDFQVSNALVAAGLCLATGSAPAPVLAALEHLAGAPGRLELAGHRRGAPVFIDYAHKPDALDNVLRTLRPMARGHLVVVFGCGGDRDAGKRPIMGDIAARLADRVIVTDDNPRSEDPARIRAAILAGAARSADIRDIGDRAIAIAAAIATLEPGDVLVIAGKGHETGQIIGDRVLPFSDIDCARAVLKDDAA